LATLGALILEWADGTRFWLTLAASVALAATTGICVRWTDRENRRILAWKASAPSDDWKRTHRSWELSHAVRAVLFLYGLALLAGALAVR
jgi:hypothetical protein